MNQKPSKLKALILLFAPSWLGTVVYSFLALFVIIVNQFADIRSLLEIPHNAQLVQIVTIWIDQLLTSLIGKSRTETLVVGLFWAVVGLVVYMFLRGIAEFIVNLDENIAARKYVWPRGTDRHKPIKRLAGQAVLRISAIFGFIFVVFVPLAAVLRGPVFVNLAGDSKPVQYVVWFVSSYIAWHLVTVTLRLMTLRARIGN